MNTQARERDQTAKTIALAAAAVSVLAYIVTALCGATLAYKDAISHIEISRRVLDSTSPGLAQLGGVWLPLPHILMLPLIWVDPLYHSGLAGSIVSMVAYVATAVLIYKIVLRLTSHKLAGVVAAIVFGCNANMLYMQSTPMTESLLYCTVVATIYCLQQWADDGGYKYLVGAGVSALLATLSRYESWPLLGCLFFIVAIIAWRQERMLGIRLRRFRTLDRLVVFGIAAFAGIATWVLYNWAIFGNPLNFQNGEYAKPSLWLGANEPAVGNWWVSAKAYWFAMGDNISWLIMALAGMGLICLVVVEFRSLDKLVVRVLPVLSLLVTVPFFISSLYTGQRPLHVMQVNHNLSNVRFGLIMLLPAAILVGYLVSVLGRIRWLYYAGAVTCMMLAASISMYTLQGHDVATFEEPAHSGDPAQQDATKAFERVYDGGDVLMQSFGNERLAFRIPPKELVYEGTYRRWLPAIHDPSGQNIAWIIERCGNYPDMICRDVTKQPNAVLVYQGPQVVGGVFYRIYRLEGAK